MATHTAYERTQQTDGQHRQLPATVDGRWVLSTGVASWPAILSGAVISFLTFVVLSSFWVALAATNEGGWWSDNLEWWEMGTAVGAAAIGAFAAGWMQSVRGATPGMISGVTVWGLTLFASLAIGIPTLVGGFTESITDALEFETAGPSGTDSTIEWAAFIAFAGGLVVSAFAGAAGGRAPRPLTLDLTGGDTTGDAEAWTRPDPRRTATPSAATDQQRRR